MREFKTVYMWSCILRAIAFVCITIAAILFGEIGVLWFYLVPLFMGISWESDPDESEDTE